MDHDYLYCCITLFSDNAIRNANNRDFPDFTPHTS